MRALTALPGGPEQRWSLDLVADGLSWRRPFSVFCVGDNVTREGLGSGIDTSLGGRWLPRELDALTARRASL
jgi:putative transposase